MSSKTSKQESCSTQQKKGSYRKNLYKITVAAIFTALALVCKLLLSFTIPVFGTGIRIGLTGIFTFFPAILCGPVYGGLSSALCDVIGCIVKPDGAYIPWFTVTAFAGGFIKGILWKLFSSKPNKTLRTVMLIFFIATAIIGISFQVSLNMDGIMSGILTTQSELPSRGQLENSSELSPMSHFMVSLAKYNNDTYTITGTPDKEEVVIPLSITVDGYKRNITKIGANAFSNAPSLTKVVFTSKITSISEDAFAGHDVHNITIAAPKDSSGAKYAQSNGFKYIETEEPTFSLEYENESSVSLKYILDGYEIKNSDTYRKNLSIYINMLTFWAEITALVGFAYILLDHVQTVVSSKRKSTNPDEKNENRFGLNAAIVKIVFCALIAGFTVTTINTEILRVFVPAYSSRTFLILWIPRLIEELIVCIIQSFAITVLFDVYKRTIEKQFSKYLR